MKRIILLLACVSLACMSSAVSVVDTVAIGETAKRASVPTAEMVPTVTAENTLVGETVTICGSVNVRSGPAADGAVIRWLVDGAPVTVYEWSEDNLWARVGVGEWVTAGSLCDGGDD